MFKNIILREWERSDPWFVLQETTTHDGRNQFPLATGNDDYFSFRTCDTSVVAIETPLLH